MTLPRTGSDPDELVEVTVVFFRMEIIFGLVDGYFLARCWLSLADILLFSTGLDLLVITFNLKIQK